MMGLVRLALRRPYTAAIASLLILLMGGLAMTRMIVDIFPIIDIPVVLVAWNYPGLSAEDMERRVVLVSERSYSQSVNGIYAYRIAIDSERPASSRSISSPAPISAARSRRSPPPTIPSCASCRRA